MVIAIPCTSTLLPATTGCIYLITNAYELVYKWFNELKKNNHEAIACVIMPNHFHAILYFPHTGYNLNKIIGNGKRLIAYEIIDRLKKHNEDNLLELLSAAVTEREKNKGQLHRVFEESSDATPVYNQNFSYRNSITFTIILLVVNGIGERLYNLRAQQRFFL